LKIFFANILRSVIDPDNADASMMSLLVVTCSYHVPFMKLSRHQMDISSRIVTCSHV